MSSNLQYYYLICDKKKKKKFIELLISYEAVFIQTNYARGSAKAGAFAKAIGFETEEHKVVLTAFVPTEKAIKLTEELKDKYDFKGSNTGMAFSIPVESLSL